MGTSQTWCGVLVCFLAAAPISVAQLSLPTVSAAPGSSVALAAMFASTTPVSGLQFDLQYDSTLISLVATPGEAVRSSSKSIYSLNLTPNLRRFLIVGLNQNPIPTGDLIDFLAILSPNAPSGSEPLTLSNIVSSDPYGEAVLVAGASGSVNVGGSAGSRLQAEGVLNAASLSSGPVAPGEIVTLIGSAIGPAIAAQPGSSVTSQQLGGISVLFDGNPGPLIYAGLNQINAIVPYEVSGQEVTQISIMGGGQVLAGFPVAVSAAAPGIFTADSSGVGFAAALNQNSSVNGPLNPANRGSIVVIFATGAGQTNPPGVDGQVAAGALSNATLPVTVQVGGSNAEVLYSGAAPGLVAGVMQVNFQVPENIAPGVASLTVTVGSTVSLGGVVIAVQ